MDREIVEQKLESLRRCLLRIEAKTPATAGMLAADFYLQLFTAASPPQTPQYCG